MSGLGLTPNEIVGYRIKPDWHSFNVVLVKKYGPNSKNAGQEYGDVLAYCRNLQFAAQYIVQHATRMYGEELQKQESESVRGTVASAEALAVAITKAEAAAMAAVADLESRIAALELTRRELVQSLGDATDTPQAEDGAADQAEGLPAEGEASSGKISKVAKSVKAK